MIVIASDHGGFNLKETIKNHLISKGTPVVDVGTSSAQEACDYPNKAKEACELLLGEGHEFAILVCGTGIGMSITANKIHGIRAAVCGDYFSAKATRAHNNSNVLCLGERVVGPGLALELVDVFLATKFEGGRHQNRVNLISEIESKY